MTTALCITALILLGIAFLLYLLPVIIEIEDVNLEKYTEPISLSLTIIVCVIGLYLQINQ
jgi:asparagine N-glycosylation enzyme membrane subunit Stt3